MVYTLKKTMMHYISMETACFKQLFIYFVINHTEKDDFKPVQ